MELSLSLFSINDDDEQLLRLQRQLVQLLREETVVEVRVQEDASAESGEKGFDIMNIVLSLIGPSGFLIAALPVLQRWLELNDRRIHMDVTLGDRTIKVEGLPESIKPILEMILSKSNQAEEPIDPSDLAQVKQRLGIPDDPAPMQGDVADQADSER